MRNDVREVSSTHPQAARAANYLLQVPHHVRHGLALGLVLGVVGLVLAFRGLGRSHHLETGLLIAGVAAVAFVFVLSRVISERQRLHARRTMLEAVAWRGDEAVLDVGCGNGFLLLEAAKQLTTGKATGIDLWKKHAGGQQADAVWRNAEIEGVARSIALADGDARQMPFEDGAFDVVLSSLMLHHVGSRADRDRAVAEIVRVTRPGGRVLLYDMLPIVSGVARQLRARGFVDVKRLTGGVLAVVAATKPRGASRKSP